MTLAAFLLAADLYEFQTVSDSFQFFIFLGGQSGSAPPICQVAGGTWKADA